MQRVAQDAQREEAVRRQCEDRHRKAGVVPGVFVGRLFVVEPNSRSSPSPAGLCFWPLPRAFIRSKQRGGGAV